MAKIEPPTHPHTTADAIVRMYKARGDAEKPRPHLGASIIGGSCSRAIWYSFRWALPSDEDGRIYRLFQRGQNEEASFVKDLRDIGVEVRDVDDDGVQFRFTDCEGHMGGSMDAVGRHFPEAPKAWAVIEFKTHGEKSFKELTEKGVKESKPKHYVQMQMYMGWAGLTRALYLAVNKNTDALHSEWIHFDKDVFDKHAQRGMDIIMMSEPPPGISTDPGWYECKWCNYYSICHQSKVAKPSCRTCASSTPVGEGQWSCNRFDTAIPLENQPDGCSEHMFIPALVPFAQVVDYSERGVLYLNKITGKEFFNGGDSCFPEVTDNDLPEMPRIYSSEELYRCPPPMVGESFVDEIKSMFGATVTGGEVFEEGEPL
jgi:hypothetical protein